MNYEYCEGRVHVIEEGDTLYQLSRRYNVPLALILRANPISDVYNLQIGDEICIPTMIGTPPEQPEMPMRPPMRQERPPMRPEMPSVRPERPSMRPEMQNRPDITEMEENSMRMDRQITMPQFQNLFVYTVEEDDSIEEILDEFEISLEDLLNFNDLDDIMLLPGSTVKVPVRRQRED